MRACDRRIIHELDRRIQVQFKANEKHLAALILTHRNLFTEHLEQARREVEAALAAHDRLVAEVDRRHTEADLAAREAVAQAFNASDKAITKAESATERRFESVNEFRAQLEHQALTFMNRAEFETEVVGLRAAQTSAAQRNADRIQELTDRMNRSEGKGDGLNSGWLYLLGALAAIGTIVSLYVAFKTGG